MVGALVAAVLSLVAAASTYLLARQYSLQQRSDSTTTQVLAAARLASTSFASGSDPLATLMAGAQLLPGSRAALYLDGTWFVSGVGISQDDLPPSLLERLGSGSAARQRTVLQSGPVTVVGYPIAERPSVWFVGVLSMQELQRTLRILQGALAVGAGLGTVGGAMIAWRLSRRVMEPLHEIGNAAEAIARGELERRVEEPSEPDLARIANGFNEMTESLRARIAREARFGATVSHELKSPLTVIKGAAELISTRRDELPARAQLGSDVLGVQIAQFERILTDLIEISRYQAGTVELQLEALSASRLLETLAARYRVDRRKVEVPDIDIIVDVRRLEQVFVNLKNNADLYAGGLEAVRGERHGDMLMIHFDDAGIGVSPGERERILEPFVRGNHHTAVQGSGLGLAITREHARAMGGDIVVGASPEGGARFTFVARVGDEAHARNTENAREAPRGEGGRR